MAPALIAAEIDGLGTPLLPRHWQRQRDPMVGLVLLRQPIALLMCMMVILGIT